MGPAAGLAAGELGGLKDVVGEFGPEAAGAAAATFGLVEVGKDLFDAALEQQTAMERLNRTFGDQAEEVQKIHLGGLNTDLEHLALLTGSNVDGLRNFAASFGQLGIDSGHAKDQVALATQEIIVLASRASVLNPTLGSADDIVQRLSTSLARGGRFLSNYGISLTSAEIQARALIDTGKSSAAELTNFEKSAAGAEIATERLGSKLGRDITSGAQSDAIAVRRLGVEIEEAKKKAGAALVEPVTESLKTLVPVLTTSIQLIGEGLTGALKAVEPELKAFATVGSLLGGAAGSGGGIGLFGAAVKNLVGQLNPLHQIDQVTSLLQGHFSDFAHGLPAIGVAFDVFDKGKSKTEQLADETKKLADQQNQQAHTTLIAAVNAGELSRADEVVAIQQHTAKDGSVDWVGVLDQLQGTIDTTASKSDQYSEAVANQAKATKEAAEVSQDLAQSSLGTLVATGQLTQAQLDHLSALNLTKQGTVDYAAVLQTVDPAAAKVAADVATIAGGLDTQATRFQLAKDEAALYKEQFDQIIQPQLDASSAADKFQASLRDETSWFGIAAQNAKAYSDTISAIVDPTLSVNEANIKLQDQIDKTNQSLAANKGIVDERTKAGRDDEQAVIDLVRAYDSEIEAMIKSGESSETVQRERQNEIDKLVDLKNHYPGLTQSVDEYIARLQEANTSGVEASRVVEAHRAALSDVISAGEKWIETLIASGANESQINDARQEEINRLEALKQQFPELGGVIDGYITKLQGIPPTKETTINLDTIQAEVNAANIHTAIDELRDKGIAITVDSVQAQLNADAAKSHVDAATQPPPIVRIDVDAAQASANASSLEGQLRSLYGLSGGTIHIGVDVQRVPGVTGPLIPGSMAGGDWRAWQPVLVGEQGPEVVTFPTDFTVHPHGHEPVSQGKLFENLIVNEVAQDPQATARATARELARTAKR